MDKKYQLTKEQAKKMVLVKEDNIVHTFYNLPFGIIGGNHSKKSVFNDIDKAYMLRLAGEKANALGHGLVIIPSKICKQSDILFVETKNKSNKEKNDTN
jgi:hypothetical protein